MSLNRSKRNKFHVQPGNITAAHVEHGIMHDIYDVHAALAIMERDNPAIRQNDYWLRLRNQVHRAFTQAYVEAVK